MDLRLEVVVLPVSDVDRAKRFYQSLNFRLDADFAVDSGYRVVQLTPPGSPCSIIFGTGLSNAKPGSVEGLQLVVDDIVAARETLIAGGAEVSEIFHDVTGVFHHAGTAGRVAGPAPGGKSYGSFASFSDPDGNGWIVQEVTTRLPGRVEGEAGSLDSAATTALLLEQLEATAAAHGLHEKNELGGAYDKEWPQWYAAHMAAALAARGFRLVGPAPR
jgi:catechol 2,3-dioxygenase-like lactoylglutathione lyase family enzyme